MEFPVASDVRRSGDIIFCIVHLGPKCTPAEAIQAEEEAERLVEQAAVLDQDNKGHHHWEPSQDDIE